MVWIVGSNHTLDSKKFKEHFDIMIFIERYPLKRCQGCVKLASKVNCNYACSLTAGPESVHIPKMVLITDVPLIFLSSVLLVNLRVQP